MANVAVIGSGMSGLTAGAYLARAGHRVTVYEQQPHIGGVTTTIRQDGYGWDIGPLLVEKLGPGEPCHDILLELGIVDQVKVQRGDRTLVFPDFDLWKPREYAGRFWRRDRLKQLFPNEHDGIDRYYQLYEQVMDLVALSDRTEKASGMTAAQMRLKLMRESMKMRSISGWSAERLMDELFKEPEIKTVFTAILADLMVRPAQFNGLGIMLANPETAYDSRIPLEMPDGDVRYGSYYVLGGIGRLAEALAGVITGSGGRILTGTPVRWIAVENGRARAVVFADGYEDPADVVVASGGVSEVFLDMVGERNLPDGFAASLQGLHRMESVFMVQLGVAGYDPARFQPSPLCYYYGTYDVEYSIDECLRGEYHEGRHGFVLYVPTMHSPELAPEGRHAVTIYTIAPNTLSQGTWSARREEMEDKLLRHAERMMPGLRKAATTRLTLTPDDFRARTGLAHHAFGGLAPVMGQQAPRHQTPLEGLWFVGSESESGGGVANVMLGARKAAKGILARLPQPKP